MNIGILVIACNRLKSLERLIHTLENSYYENENVDLIISIDKSDTTEVSTFAQNYVWNHGKYKVIIQKEKLGLRKHVLSCGDYSQYYDGLVVLEDDISVSPNFFFYAKACIKKYKDDDRIAGISLYNFPLSYVSSFPFTPLASDSDVFFMQVAQSWGQIWMPKQWKEFRNWYETHKDEDFNTIGNIPKPLHFWPESSWLKYHMWYCIDQSKYFVYPYNALSTNNSESGIHNALQNTFFQSNLCFLKKTNYVLKDFDEQDVVKYNGFFYPFFLGHFLGISESELLVDFWGVYDNTNEKKYLLTTQKWPYKIVKSYALQYKPIELNIMMNAEGESIFLYDTTQTITNNSKINDIDIFKYFYPDFKKNLLKIMGGKTGLVQYLFKRKRWIN